MRRVLVIRLKIIELKVENFLNVNGIIEENWKETKNAQESLKVQKLRLQSANIEAMNGITFCKNYKTRRI